MTGRANVLEKEFQEAVIDAAHLFGWTVAHFRAARTKHGWRTPVAADGKGFPDLVMCHPVGGVWFVELKSDTGKLSDDQEAWLVRLSTAGANVAVWRPDDWPQIQGILDTRRD